MNIPEKCKKCIHRLNDFCRAYKAKIEILEVKNCTRRKTKKRREILREKYKKIRGIENGKKN